MTEPMKCRRRFRGKSANVDLLDGTRITDLAQDPVENGESFSFMPADRTLAKTLGGSAKRANELFRFRNVN